MPMIHLVWFVKKNKQKKTFIPPLSCLLLDKNGRSIHLPRSWVEVDKKQILCPSPVFKQAPGWVFAIEIWYLSSQLKVFFSIVVYSSDIFTKLA